VSRVPPDTPDTPDSQARLLRMMYDFTVSRALFAACELGIADALAETRRRGDELAAAVGMPADSLRRLMRLLVATGVFCQDESGRYACTGLGELLQAGHEQSVRDEFRQHLEYLAFADLVPALRSGQAALAMDGGLSYYERLDQLPGARDQFQRACRSRSRSAFGSLLASHPWQPGETVADLGGGLGHHLDTVLAAQPTATGVLVDRPAVIEDAKSQPRPPGVANRIRYVPADFSAGPLPAADVYLLINVLHNLPDEPAVALLRRVRDEVPACRQVVVAEQIVPDEGSHPALTADLWMLVLLDGRERTAAEYQALLAAGGWELAGHEHDPRQLSDLLCGVPAD
jgi:hypothetical protein